MTVVASRAPRLLALRWFMVVGAMFAVALFGGVSYGDRMPQPVSMAGYAACPNVIFQASLPGALTAGTDDAGGARDGGHGLGQALAGVCLFVVVAIALAGSVRGPLLVFVACWWARLGLAHVRPAPHSVMWTGVLRI